MNEDIDTVGELRAEGENLNGIQYQIRRFTFVQDGVEDDHYSAYALATNHNPDIVRAKADHFDKWLPQTITTSMFVHGWVRIVNTATEDSAERIIKRADGINEQWQNEAAAGIRALGQYDQTDNDG